MISRRKTTIQAGGEDPIVTVAPIIQGITQGNVSIEAITNITAKAKEMASLVVIRAVISLNEHTLHRPRKYDGMTVDEMEIQDIVMRTRTTHLYHPEDGMMLLRWGHPSVKHIKDIWCRMMTNLWTSNLQ